MEFCDECGSLMKKHDDAWICGSCGHETTAGAGAETQYVLTEGQQASTVIESAGADAALPTTNARCPECEHTTAYWYLQQIRSADESETRFFVCTECEHRWREDDH